MSRSEAIPVAGRLLCVARLAGLAACLSHSSVALATDAATSEPAVAEASCERNSRAALDLLAQIRERSRELDAREQALDARERSDAEMASARAELVSFRRSVEHALAALEARRGAEETRLADVIGRMPPARGAALLDGLEPALAARVLSRVRPARAAALLAELPPKRAAALSESLVPTAPALPASLAPTKGSLEPAPAR